MAVEEVIGLVSRVIEPHCLGEREIPAKSGGRVMREAKGSISS